MSFLLKQEAFGHIGRMVHFQPKKTGGSESRISIHPMLVVNEVRY